MVDRCLAALTPFAPANEQEAQDYATIWAYIQEQGLRAFTREDRIAHITSSGFVMDTALEHVLMVHHTLRNTWAWTGGHADGETDLLDVALREAREETGIHRVEPLSLDIASVDVLHMPAHIRRGVYVGTHLHLSIAYILVCPKDEPLRVKPDENTQVAWFALEDIRTPLFDAADVYLYQKLAAWAKRHGTMPGGRNLEGDC